MKTKNMLHGKAAMPLSTLKKKRPENKDGLDSREGEEQLSKGNDYTHNKRETQSERKKVK